MGGVSEEGSVREFECSRSKIVSVSLVCCVGPLFSVCLGVELRL